MVEGSGCRVAGQHGSACRQPLHLSWSFLRVKRLVFRVQGLAVGVEVLGFRVWGLGLRV